MPAILLDLDNTLVDRRGAFAEAAADFVRDHDGSPDDLDWLIDADADGYTPWPQLSSSIKGHFGLPASPTEIADAFRARVVDHIHTYPGVVERLVALREAGNRLVVVTNGTEHQQNSKIDTAGLRPLLDAVVISEAAGFRKPDPRVFHQALAGAGATAAGSWMVGDHPDNDIRGGAGVGLRTAWVSFGEEWIGNDPPALSAAEPRRLLGEVLERLTSFPSR